jgi:hypothetical protein
VAKPDALPMIDQHTVRAFLALTSGKVTKKPKITWDQWEKYRVFFQVAVVDAGSNDNIEDRSEVDRALFAWGKSLKTLVASKLNPRTQEPLTAQSMPSFWGQQVPNTGVIPSACNVLKALQEYLKLRSLGALPPYKRTNLRNLQFHKVPQSVLTELIQDSGGNVSRQLLQNYREKIADRMEIGMLPRPILDVFLVGWANRNGICGTTRIAAYLYANGFGGTINAAQAAVQVGKTTGKLFGLLNDDGAPTGLFGEYFEA